MKKFFLVLSIILTLSLASCASTDKANINEFIDRYNYVSEIPITKETITTYRIADKTIHHIVINENIILALKSDSSCEIIECSVTTSNSNKSNQFNNVCVYTLMSVTDCDKINADKAVAKSFNKPTTVKEYEISTDKDNIQTTIIIRLLTENKNNNPTLKEFLK